MRDVVDSPQSNARSRLRKDVLIWRRPGRAERAGRNFGSFTVLTVRAMVKAGPIHWTVAEMPHRGH